MARQDKNQKSARLKELEDVFERRTRRFSPFEVLGLKDESKDGEKQDRELPPASPFLPVGEKENSEKSSRPMGGSDPPTHGSSGPGPGVGRPTIVVVDNIYTTTTKIPPMGGSDPPTPGSPFISPFYSPDTQTQAPTSTQEHLTTQADTVARSSESAMPGVPFAMANVVAATQAGAQLGPKARKVLAYLNTIRSLEHEAYTVPV